jgi:hypothetical protein
MEFYVVHSPNQSPVAVCQSLVSAVTEAEKVIGTTDHTLEKRNAPMLYYLTDNTDESNTSRIELVPSKIEDFSFSK